MKEFPFLFLSLLKNIILDVVKCATTLKSQVAISEDVVLMFDEMYLQRCEEYSAGEITEANENKDYSHYDRRIKRKCPLCYQICSRTNH